ncbi:DUF4193 family protein [Paeniglutamicibacter psychrophenolicus]|uniref:DUF4193 family protein n=1 Tax=Paeniglutamicibacter psychrophenolicus TaxID=257454 RepID=UPI002789BE2C|nr:DUF4193 family protein [Paeniglutamicibacter psychrophenolicus]MDQ0094619.1 hypothetical protein [Paeniglutamicibacter psychrophenolicus]
MAQDYDDARPEVAEAAENTLQDVRKIDAPDAKSDQAKLEEADISEGTELPGAIVLDELVVEVVPQAQDEFFCGQRFTVRHRSQAAEEVDGLTICRDCAEL